jgi:hypothetical protein
MAAFDEEHAVDPHTVLGHQLHFEVVAVGVGLPAGVLPIAVQGKLLSIRAGQFTKPWGSEHVPTSDFQAEQRFGVIQIDVQSIFTTHEDGEAPIDGIASTGRTGGAKGFAFGSRGRACAGGCRSSPGFVRLWRAIHE